MFVGVPVIGSPFLSPENLHLAWGGVAGFTAVAIFTFLAGFQRLLKEKAIHFPGKPAIPVPVVLLIAVAGMLIGLAIIHFANLLTNFALTLWVFLLCTSISSFVGLYLAGLRIGKFSRTRN